MKDQKKVEEAVFHAVDEINKQLPNKQKLKKSLDTVVFGKSGKLNSLRLVYLILEIEQNIEEAFGVSITLANEKAISQKNSPFKTVGTIIDYASKLIGEKINE